MTVPPRTVAVLTALALAIPAAVFPQASRETDRDALDVARASLAETGPSIDHSPLTCLEQGLFPEVRAGIESAALVQNGRVYFKAHDCPDWYYVEMARDEARHLAVLPKPLPRTAQVDYFVYMVDSRLQTARTPESEAVVSKTCNRAGARRGKQAEPWITVFGTKDGQAPVPAGFHKAGIVAFVSVAGAMVTEPTTVAHR